jgi:hypothetical protein
MLAVSVVILWQAAVDAAAVAAAKPPAEQAPGSWHLKWKRLVQTKGGHGLLDIFLICLEETML